MCCQGNLTSIATSMTCIEGRNLSFLRSLPFDLTPLYEMDIRLHLVFQALSMHECISERVEAFQSMLKRDYRVNFNDIFGNCTVESTDVGWICDDEFNLCGDSLWCSIVMFRDHDCITAQGVKSLFNMWLSPAC